MTTTTKNLEHTVPGFARKISPVTTRHPIVFAIHLRPSRLLKEKGLITEIVQKAHAVSRCDTQGHYGLLVSVVFSYGYNNKALEIRGVVDGKHDRTD
jgi:hypothetical protein